MTPVGLNPQAQRRGREEARREGHVLRDLSQPRGPRTRKRWMREGTEAWSQPPGTSGNCSEGKEGAASCRRGNSMWEGLSGGRGTRWPGGEPGCQGLSRDHKVGGLSCYFLGLQFTLTPCQGPSGLASSAVQPHPCRACPTSHILTPTSALAWAWPRPCFSPLLPPPHLQTLSLPSSSATLRPGCDPGSPERARDPLPCRL